MLHTKPGGAVDYALSFGFHPHPDFRHAATLLLGIDPATCPQEFTFGRDGKPFYIGGPNESPQRARAIAERIRDAGGHYMVEIRDPSSVGITEIEDEYDDLALPEP